jgi:hypothetical protein
VARKPAGSAKDFQLAVPGIAAVPANLLPIAAAREVTHPHGGPAKLRHQFAHAPKGARSTVALWDLKQVQECLGADSLQPIKIIDSAAHALKRKQPRIGGFRRGRSSRFYPLFSRWQGADPNHSEAKDITSRMAGNRRSFASKRLE